MDEGVIWTLVFWLLVLAGLCAFLVRAKVRGRRHPEEWARFQEQQRQKEFLIYQRKMQRRPPVYTRPRLDPWCLHEHGPFNAWFLRNHSRVPR